MKEQELAKKTKGFQTVNSLSRVLGVEKRTAINYISELRKAGYIVATTRGSKKIRLYEITEYPHPQLGHSGLYDFINAHSSLKVSKPYEHIIYDSKMTPERAIADSIETKDFRVILASLPLFRSVTNWPKLYALAKKTNSQKSVGALYDLARKYVKARRMDRRIRNMLLQSKQTGKYIV